jgi:hypothetical protein
MSAFPISDFAFRERITTCMEVIGWVSPPGRKDLPWRAPDTFSIHGSVAMRTRE